MTKVKIIKTHKVQYPPELIATAFSLNGAQLVSFNPGKIKTFHLGSIYGFGRKKDALNFIKWVGQDVACLLK